MHLGSEMGTLIKLKKYSLIKNFIEIVHIASGLDIEKEKLLLLGCFSNTKKRLNCYSTAVRYAVFIGLSAL
jgi:hypothetical protein